MDHEKVKERVRCQLQPVKPERKTAVGEKIKSSRGTRWYLKLVVRGCHTSPKPAGTTKIAPLELSRQGGVIQAL